METPKRSAAKALTWQSLGLVSMLAITWGLTGSLATGGAIAVAGTLAGAVTYVIHERVWARVTWGIDRQG